MSMFFSEQRVSALLMAILTGLSVFFTKILSVCISKNIHYFLINIF
jgi:hypothetical protein